MSPARRRKRLTERRGRETPAATQPYKNNHASNPKSMKNKREGERRLKRGLL